MGASEREEALRKARADLARAEELAASYRLAARMGASEREEALRKARADLARAEELAAGVSAEASVRMPAGSMSVIAEARQSLSAIR
jgi:hypothetical protein